MTVALATQGNICLIPGPLVSAPETEIRLTALQWRARWEAHRTRAREWTIPCRARLDRGKPHPVHDFLMTYEAIAVETEAGRREYEAEQHRISERGAPLRERLITALDKLLTVAQNNPAAPPNRL